MTIVYFVRRCDLCKTIICTGKEWVREKIPGQNAYRHYHAENPDCWEQERKRREAEDQEEINREAT